MRCSTYLLISENTVAVPIEVIKHNKPLHVFVPAFNILQAYARIHLVYLKITKMIFKKAISSSYILLAVNKIFLVP